MNRLKILEERPLLHPHDEERERYFERQFPGHCSQRLLLLDAEDGDMFAMYGFGGAMSLSLLI